MPIGRLIPPSAEGSAVVPNGEVVGNVRKGAAVALVSNGSGRTQIVECSAVYYGDKFYGFAQKSATGGANLVIQTMRGSIITPIIEGGRPIAPEDPIFLSRTSGEVTVGPPEKYLSGIFGISYTGADPGDPQTLTTPSGVTADLMGVVNFPILSGDTWVFRAIFLSRTDCTVEFRVTGTEAYFYWNSQMRGEVSSMNPDDATVKFTGGPSTNSSGVIPVRGGGEYPIVLMGRSGNLTLEWSINGGAWQTDGLQNLRKYVTTDYLSGPIVTQVGFGVSNCEITLVLDQRVRVL
jgi:hypothetical protein